MFSIRLLLTASLLVALHPPAEGQAQTQPVVRGELKRWHAVHLLFTGPASAETATPNPFRDYRMDVTFTQATTGRSFVMPGAFAADGDAAESSATAGNQWRVIFTPVETGEWRWRVSFRAGPDAALNPGTGRSWAPLDGATGALRIGDSDKAPPDFRARGMLEYVGERYLRFSGDGAYFLKAGVGSPETLLGYHDFDGTYLDTAAGRLPAAPNDPIQLPSLENGLHRYPSHVQDWREGDPMWQGGKGKGLIGGLNYLASQGVNALYFLTMNVNGDGRNVWPWTAPWPEKGQQRDRFDVSKLDQWEIAIAHMTRLGIMPHIVLQETENDHLLDDGDLGAERKLYLREMVARFGHHPALTWNLGEENVQTPEQRKAFAAYLRETDPYPHHIVIHNDHWHARNISETFDSLLGFKAVTGTSLQDFFWNDIHTHVKRYVRASAAAGHPWVVASDELGGANFGTLPDAEDGSHDLPRRFGLWGTLMAGGAGTEWYFGWQNNSPHSDLSAEDWRTREEMYRQTRVAHEFFRQLPFHQMQPEDGLATGHGVFAMSSRPGAGHDIRVLYLPHGGATRLELGPRPGLYEIKWYDPRKGGPLQDGSLRFVRGPGISWTGDPPTASGAAEPPRLEDWAVVIRRIAETAPPMQFPGAEWSRARPEELGIDPSGMRHALNQWKMAVGPEGIDRVLVIRRGVVVWSGPKADLPANVFSVTKSFTSTALGLLIADGKLTLDTRAASIDRHLLAQYPLATLRHFTTMTSGYSAPGASRWGEASQDWSATPFTPGTPLFAPGSQFAYWDEAQMMLGRLLTMAGGEDLLTYLQRRVFQPIGLRVKDWTTEGATPGGIPIRNGCTGLNLDAWELARFGHLFLNNGRWEGKQLAPQDWIREATRAQVSAGVPVANTDRSSIDGRGVYGFNWWTNGIGPGGQRMLPDAPPGTYAAQGLNHNILLVIPEWEMVVVRLGADRNPPRGHAYALNRFLRRMAQAVSPLE